MQGGRKSIGRYEVLRELGRGGMGIVYLARDPVIGREVAVKMLELGGFTEEQAREIKERFQREAMAAGRLNDHRIVTVYDMGEEGADWFIAMEYVQGRSLEDVLEEDAMMSLPRIVGIIDDIAAALDHAHANGIIHRDIKPANILLPDRTGAKITDFGIARIENVRITREGAMLGSPSYMSPEQILGRDVDYRSDIFALGVILYIMLTGEKPFPGESLATLSYRIVREDPTPPSQLNPSLSPAFDALVAKALAKDPSQRCQSAGEMARELRVIAQVGVSCDPMAGVVVQTFPSTTPVGTLASQSIPSITAIPIAGSEKTAITPVFPSDIQVAGTEKAKWTPPARLIAGAAALLVLIIVGLWIASMGVGTREEEGGALVPSVSAGQLEPLGIVPRPFLLWRDASKAMEAGNFKDAHTLLKELALLSPSDAEVHLAMGKTTFKLGKEEDAMSEYRIALQLDPGLKKDPALIAGMVELLESRQHSKDAMAILSDMVGEAAEPALIEAAASPKQSLSKNALITLTVIWSKRLEANPKDVDTWLVIARAYYKLNDHKKAIEAYNKALAGRPAEGANPEVILNLVAMLDGPSDRMAMDTLAVIGTPAVAPLKQVSAARGAKMLSNATETLIRIWKEQVKAEPANASAAFELAFKLVEKKNVPEALLYLSTALQRDPSLASEPRVLPFLMDVLKTPNGAKAADIIAKQVGQPAVAGLIESLKSPDYALRSNSASALTLMGHEKDVDWVGLWIINLTSKDTSCAVKKEAFKNLEASGDPRAQQAVESANQDRKMKKCLRESSSTQTRDATNPAATSPSPAPAASEPKKSRFPKIKFPHRKNP